MTVEVQIAAAFMWAAHAPDPMAALALLETAAGAARQRGDRFSCWWACMGLAHARLVPGPLRDLHLVHVYARQASGLAMGHLTPLQQALQLAVRAHRQLALGRTDDGTCLGPTRETEATLGRPGGDRP